MAKKSFYDTLEVDKSATLEEIKLAFKRRALQVHPDKGGSKESFHLVYQALETLADPAARKKYDQGPATGKSGNLAQPQPDGQTGRKKTSKKRGRSAASKAQPKPEKTERPKAKAARGQAEPESETPQAPQSKQTKLLIKIRDLLKQLPRDVRNDVFTKQFSQQQRLILEKWMVEGSSATQGCSESQVHTVDKTDKTAMRPENRKTCVTVRGLNSTDVPKDLSCTTLAVPAATRWKLAAKRKAREKNESKKRVRRICGSVHRGSKTNAGTLWYSTRIKFDAMHIYTRGRLDLQTALEYLVILTSVKQKMQEVANKGSTFEERLQEALASSAKGQRADLDLRFSVLQAVGSLIAPSFVVHTPMVRSVEHLGKLRKLLEPFRQYAQIPHRQCIFWLYSPVHLQDAWGRLQVAVSEAWKIAGADSTKYIQKLRACYEAAASARQRQLQLWERMHMAMQDRNRYRPRRMRVGGSQKSTNLVTLKLSTLKTLLARWERALHRQRKKHQEKRRRLENLKRKRLREEQIRREAFRKRKRPSESFMDDIPWI